jgi:hypothetical protein
MEVKKPSHAMRGLSARMAQLEGVTESAIRQAGRWANGAMENFYLYSFSMVFCRQNAGFSVHEKNYRLPRAILEPPESLQKSIFPQGN